MKHPIYKINNFLFQTHITSYNNNLLLLLLPSYINHSNVIKYIYTYKCQTLKKTQKLYVTQ